MKKDTLDTLESNTVATTKSGSRKKTSTASRKKSPTKPAQSELRKAASETTSEVKQKAGEIVETAKKATEERADNYISTASSHAHNISAATKGTSEKLRKTEPEFVAQGFDWLADQIDSVANYLDSKSASEITRDAKNFARKRPAAVIGGLAAFGFLAGRALKATDSEETSDNS